MKSAGYVRCSTLMQEDSPEQQRKTIQAFADQKGYEVIEWFEDKGESGTTFDKRPGFQRLLAKVENHPNFSVVICFDESRWGRAIDAEENTYWRVHFRKHGVNVVLCKTAVDSSSEFAPMLTAFEGVQASSYSKKLSELTLRGAMNNKQYSNGGTAPYGYVRVAENLKKGTSRVVGHKEGIIKYEEKVRWAPGDPGEIAVVQRIFKLRLEGKGYGSIVEILNKEHVPCPKRGRWRSKDQKWSSVTIKSILENPAYYGARAYNRNSMSEIQAGKKGKIQKKVKYPHWKNDESEWILMPNAHEALVSEEEWMKANSMKAKYEKRNANGYTYRSPYLLTGLVYCSRCGFHFQGWSGKAKGHSYFRYVDSGWQNKRICSYFSIERDELENYAVDCIRKTITDVGFTTLLEHELEMAFNQREDGIAGRESRLLGELRQCTSEIDNLVGTLASGVRSEAIVMKLSELEARKIELEKGLAVCRTEALRNFEVIDLAANIRRFSEAFDDIFARADIEGKKELMKIWIREIVVDRDKDTVQVYVRKIPAIVPEVVEKGTNKKGTHKVVSTQSSGDRT